MFTEIFDLNQTEVYRKIGMDYYDNEKVFLITMVDASDEGDLDWDTIFVDFIAHPELYKWVEDIYNNITSLIIKIDYIDEKSDVFDYRNNLNEDIEDNYSICCINSGYMFGFDLHDLSFRSPYTIIEHSFDSWGRSKRHLTAVLNNIRHMCKKVLDCK